MAVLADGRVIVTDPELVGELDQKGYGEREKDKLILSPEESLYLVEKRKNFVVQDPRGKELSFEQLLKKFSRLDKEFGRKYLVFKDLRERGFCVRTGFKWGTHYRVYARGDRPGKGHAIWLVHVVPEEYKCSFPELSRAVRLAQNVRKKMVYAVLDKEGDITYYKVERITP